jgi:hypothetical protein
MPTPFERKLYILRKAIGHSIQALKLPDGKMFYVPSMSSRTVVYKGMLLANQVGTYFLDLQDAARGFGAGTGAPALLHQHLPDLGSGPPLPHDCPQRRNQHLARQRQLDEVRASTAFPRRYWARTWKRSGR